MTEELALVYTNGHLLLLISNGFVTVQNKLGLHYILGSVI